MLMICIKNYNALSQQAEYTYTQSFMFSSINVAEQLCKSFLSKSWKTNIHMYDYHRITKFLKIRYSCMIGYLLQRKSILSQRFSETNDILYLVIFERFTKNIDFKWFVKNSSKAYCKFLGSVEIIIV